MLIEYRQARKNNIIKFLIGLILLGFSGFYMSYSRAELISIISTFSILSEKAKVSWTRVVGNDRKVLGEKQKFIREYENLLQTVEKAHCFTNDEIQDLKIIINKLKSTSNSNFKKEEVDYIIQGSKYMQKLKDDCIQ